MSCQCNQCKVKELEAKNAELEEMLEDEIALSKEIEQNYLEAKEKLEIAVACLKELNPIIEQSEDWELGKWIDEALTAIKGASNE